MKDKIVTATARTDGFGTVLGHTEVKAFPGAFTDLQAGRTDEIAFICPLDLFFYPFDVQVCKMPLRLIGHANDATWNATQMSTALGDHLTLTLLSTHEFTIRLHPDQETAVVVVKLGRRYDAYFINTMLPCMLLEVIGFLTHAFPIQDFSNRCTATLSCLIVKAAFFLQISGTLPKTADPKLVDVWMFGNVFVLSLIFLAHVAVLHVQRRYETSKSTPKKGCVAWDEEIIQDGTGYRIARYVNLVGLATSMLVCIMLLSGIGVAAARGKMAAMML
ncbi:acetylcholine receptor subunit epsilon-like [Scylla paramamosain]|uniref:acetylcholine receptor subunit epsilon-like n=1 Tax=Scylla paramamosain TaxID=85552 RepID=UPI003083DE82